MPKRKNIALEKMEQGIVAKKENGVIKKMIPIPHGYRILWRQLSVGKERRNQIEEETARILKVGWFAYCVVLERLDKCTAWGRIALNYWQASIGRQHKVF